MGDYLRAGALTDNWTDPALVSMARDIEAELEALVQLPPDDDPVPRRKILIAIATGVINHLKNNANALAVPDVPSANTVQVHPTITVQT
jgi:hypothetical protein